MKNQKEAVWKIFNLGIEKLKINDLLAEYTLSIDRRDPEGWANCFTEDGLIGTGDRFIRGRANLREYGMIHSKLGSRHLTTSPLYEIAEDGQNATGHATTVVMAATVHGFKILFVGSYKDKLKKIGGQWLFAERWVQVESMPDRPDFYAGSADSDVAVLTQPLFEAFERIGEKM